MPPPAIAPLLITLIVTSVTITAGHRRLPDRNISRFHAAFDIASRRHAIVYVE